jgi:hypothetical protein
MSIESGTPHQSEEGQQVNEEEAWAGAYAEKPMRDSARRPGVSEDEKTIIDRLAGRLGEEGMNEYKAEKEKNPVQRLISRVESVAAGMRVKSLDTDAYKLEKVKGRVERFADLLKKNKTASGSRNASSLLFSHLVSSEYVMTDEIPVVAQIGDGGGDVRSPGATGVYHFGESGDRKKFEGFFDDAEAHGAEVINYSFTDRGETEFLRGLGVIGEKEEASDVPAIYEKAANKGGDKGRRDAVRINPDDYRVVLPTNINGVNVVLEKVAQKGRGSDSWADKSARRVSLKLDAEFLNKIPSRE